jgi:hypothetical protein
MATQPLQDFGRVLRTIFRYGRNLSYGLIGVFVVWAGFQVHAVVALAAGVHWTLGVATFLAIAFALGWFVGRPVARFLKAPVALKPPDLPPPAQRTSKDLVRHLDFVERYVEALGRNPEWTGTPESIAQAVATCRTLREEAGRAEGPASLDLSRRLAAFEGQTVGGLLAPLDRKASDAIRAEAVGVGIATAVSPNGRIDAFIVLWRACNLVSRVAAIYYGRPGPRGTLTILRDVSAATIASAYLQDLGEMAGGMVGAVAGTAAGVMTGPLLDGSLNAVAMCRIGYLAKSRCRAFTAWTEKTRAQATREALAEAGRMAKGVLVDLVKTVGGGILKLPFRILGKLTDAVTGLFRSSEPEPSEARSAAP